MAVHHGPQGIRVNCVCPGMVYTPMMYAPGMSDEARAARASRSILKTEGTGWDIGAAVRFLAGDEARWMVSLSNRSSDDNELTFTVDCGDITSGRRCDGRGRQYVAKGGYDEPWW